MVMADLICGGVLSNTEVAWKFAISESVRRIEKDSGVSKDEEGFVCLVRSRES